MRVALCEIPHNELQDILSDKCKVQNTQYDTIMQPQTHTQNNMFLEVNMGLSVVISKGMSVMLGLFYDKKKYVWGLPWQSNG